MDNKDALIFITGNAGKAEYLAKYFKIPVEHRMLDLPEIQSLSLEEVVEDKAERAYKILQQPVLVEDVSLVFKAMGKLPGPLVKWFLDSLQNEGLCRMLNAYTDRSAVAEVQFAYYDEKGVETFSGTINGTIAKEPRGENGFGWDPIFIPEGYMKTWAEMTPDEKHDTSMRGIALEKLKKFLEEKKAK